MWCFISCKGARIITQKKIKMKKLFTSFALFFALFSTVQAGNCPGEFNCDGIINVLDLNIMLAEFGQTGPGLVADMNCDGTVNTADMLEFLGVFGTTCCKGDMDYDGIIGAGDLTIWLGYYGSNCLQGDVNCDGTLNTADLLCFLGTFGTTYKSGAPSKRVAATDAILEIYPNPSTDKITINSALALDLPEVSIELRDFTGRLVETYRGVNKIDLSNLETGTYLVQMRINEILLESQKVVKY